jgi:redox-sensitive bicupin YhaK (pirin superfamily)
VAHTTLLPGGEIESDPENVDELAVYVMVGSAAVAGQMAEAGRLARLSAGGKVRIHADAGAEIIIIGGDPLDAPIHRYGPFVMNSTADLEFVIRNYQSGRMGVIHPT